MSEAEKMTDRCPSTMARMQCQLDAGHEYAHRHDSLRWRLAGDNREFEPDPRDAYIAERIIAVIEAETVFPGPITDKAYDLATRVGWETAIRAAALGMKQSILEHVRAALATKEQGR